MKTTVNSNILLEIINKNSVNKNSFIESIAEMKTHKNNVIYGAGSWGRWMLQLLQNHSVDIFAFLDKSADQIDNINGIPVFKPEGDDFSQKEKEEINIIIASNYMHHKNIKLSLCGLGYKNVNVLKNIWYAGVFKFEPDIIISERKRILECAGIFEDEKSYKIYEDSISSFLRGESIMSINADTHNQYFPEDVFFSKGYSKFIDCGAYNGDTILSLNIFKGRVNSLIAFEPDRQNYLELLKTVKSYGERIADNIIMYPNGVWSTLEQLKFNSGQGASSAMLELGTEVIQCVALDDVLISFVPTFIKMDIEGAEYEALIGAKNIIHRYKPDLAICVYHSISDFFRIPLLIKNWNLGYKFYLRCHFDNNQEVVLYAVSN